MKLPREVTDMLSDMGIKPSERWAEVWEIECARALTFAQMARAGQVREIQKALVKSCEQGITKEQFIKQLGPLLEERGWKPKGRGGDMPCGLRRIYDINRRIARAEGQWNRIQRSKEKLPYLLYTNESSGQRCPDHVALEGVCLPVDDEWWGSYFPPNGGGCRCFVRQVSSAEQTRLRKTGKIKTQAPPVRRKRWVDIETGGVRMVAEGLDPLWDHNVGKEPWVSICRGCEREANRFCNEIGSVATEKLTGSLVKSTTFGEFAKIPPAGNTFLAMPIAVLHDLERQVRSSESLRKHGAKVDSTLEKIRDNSSVVVLKAGSAWKQLVSRKNEGFPWTEYQKVQALVRQVEWVRIRENRDGGVRLTGAAKHGQMNYAIILDFEKETKRTALVTLFHLGEGDKRPDRFRNDETQMMAPAEDGGKE